MTETKHTLGEMVACNIGELILYQSSDNPAGRSFTTPLAMFGPGQAMNAADAARIAACWNACVLMGDPATAVPLLVEAMEDMWDILAGFPGMNTSLAVAAMRAIVSRALAAAGR